MSIQLVTGFLVNAAETLDNRIVASGSAARNAIPYKYVGLRVFDTFNNRAYYWDGTSFNPEITDQVNGTTNYVPKFTSQYYIGNSNIYIDSYRVGLNTNSPIGDYTYLQIGGTNNTEDPSWFSGQSSPMVIHKGGTTVIGNNWYYSGSEQAFDTSKGSTTINFDTTTGDLSVKIRPAGNVFSNQKQGLYISQLGRVGIGNNFGPSSPPTASLDVTGDIISSTDISANSGTVYAGYVTVNSAGSTNRPSRGIVIYDTTPNASISSPPPDGNGLFIDWAANVPGDINYYAGILGYSKGINGGDLRFYTTNRGDIAQPASVGSVILNSTYRPVRMTILNTGNVGIGTTSPTTLLQVAGTASSDVVAIGDGSSSNPSLVFSSNTNTGIYKYGTDTIGFLAGGVIAARIDSTGLISDKISYIKSLRARSSSYVLEDFIQKYFSINPSSSSSQTFDTITSTSLGLGSSGSAVIYIECNFFSRMATGTMTPTQYYGLNSLRSIFVLSSGNFSLISTEDIAGNTPTPMTPLNNNAMLVTAINQGVIDYTTTPGSLIIKQSVTNSTVSSLTCTFTCEYKITMVY